MQTLGKRISQLEDRHTTTSVHPSHLVKKELVATHHRILAHHSSWNPVANNCYWYPIQWHVAAAPGFISPSGFPAGWLTGSSYIATVDGLNKLFKWCSVWGNSIRASGEALGKLQVALLRSLIQLPMQGRFFLRSRELLMYSCSFRCWMRSIFLPAWHPTALLLGSPHFAAYRMMKPNTCSKHIFSGTESQHWFSQAYKECCVEQRY